MSTQSDFSGMKYRLFTSLWLTVFTLLLLLGGCGEGPVDAPETATEAKPLVSSMITNVDTLDSVPDSEISEDSYGRRIARTKMMIVFKPDASAEEASALLSDIDATITSSLKGARSVVVRIPDPGTLDAYDAIVSDIEDRAFVDFVMKGEMPGMSMLPSNYYNPPVLSEISYLDHHLAVHAHAAWNARNAIRHSPQVLIADNFGDGAPTPNSINYTGIIYDFSNTTLDSHGYYVLGILAGVHETHYTTGIFPDTINLRAIDGKAGLDWVTTLNRILQMLSSNPGKWVVNTSMGYEVCTGINGHCTELEKARQWAEIWIEEVRRLGLENRVLHVAAAGNIETPPGINIRDAETDSTFASARLLSGLTDALGNPLPNLTNTLIIENAVNTVVDPNNIQPVKTKCLSVNSFVGGDLAAIGEDVWSYIDAIGNQGGYSGTSMAVPEVAGLAAYLWSIDSSPSAQQILSAIYTNSRPVPVVAGDPACSDWPDPAPVIDAYAALLSLDATSNPTPANSPVRLALLDVNEDGAFEETDLALFIDQYFDTSATPPVPLEPAAPDYGRYDLNGDGWTGSDHTADFDLDRSGSIQYGPAVLGNATQDIEGDSVDFNENSLTDMQILCYYAYSPLYTGDGDARQRIMDPVLDQCGAKSWHTPEIIGTGFSVRLANDGAGNAVAVWMTGYGAPGFPCNSNQYTVNVGWGAPVSLGSGEMMDCNVAMGAAGATAVWRTETDQAPETGIFASHAIIGGAWQAASKISGNYISYRAPSVGMDAAGNTVVVWEYGGTDIIHNQYLAGSGWSTASAFVNPTNDDASEPEVAMSRNGHVMAVWRQYGPSGAEYIYGSYYPSGGGWRAEHAIEDNSNGYTHLISPKVAVSSSGNAVVIWRARGASSADDAYASYGVNDSWGQPQLLDGAAGRVIDLDVAMDDAGNAIAIWKQADVTIYDFDIWANYYLAGSGWQGAERIETGVNRADAPQVAMHGASGKAIAVWMQDDHIYANYFTPGSGWKTPEVIDTGAVIARDPQIVIDDAGTATAVWYSGGIVYASRYE